MKCKHCHKDVGHYYAVLEAHLWNHHREIIMKFLVTQIEPPIQTGVSREGVRLSIKSGWAKTLQPVIWKWYERVFDEALAEKKETKP